MKRFSITTKITLWYTIFLVLISVLLVAVLIRYYDFREQSAAEHQLIGTVEDVSDIISARGSDFQHDDEIIYYTGDAYISVYDQNGEFITGAKPENIKVFPEIKLDETSTFEDESGKQWYVYDTTVYMRDGPDLYIRGMMNNTGYESTGDLLPRFLTFTLPILIILAIGGGWIISRRALRPIRDVLRVTEEIRQDADLTRRVPVPDSSDETQDLAESINGMFDRIEEVVEQERRFASDVSHELRTPLTIIRTQSEFAMEEPDFAQNALRTINRESHRMSNLVTTLLTLARSDSGGMKPVMAEVDVYQMLKDLADQAGIAAADRNITVEFVDETSDGSMVIISDEDFLMRIVLNLLDNAVHYGKSPGGRIELRVRREGNEAVITVADDGEGVSDSDRSKIWNRFYQTDTARTRVESAGLGLSMVSALTASLGGSIRLLTGEEKRKGELPGAVFELRLPAV